MRASAVRSEGQKTKFDLTCTMEEADERVAGTWGSAADLYDEKMVRRMRRHWERLVEEIVSDPGKRIGELSMLTEEERQQAVVEWNDSGREWRGGGCVHECCEEEVERGEDRIAVEHGDEYLTYGELNGRANQVANYLRGRGVGSEVCVGVCMERGLELVVALLGILKAGGTYVPLDPSFPAERLSYMVGGRDRVGADRGTDEREVEQRGSACR